MSLPPPSRPNGLTERELQVLRMLPSGATYAEIGETLGIDTNTVKSHLQRVYTKLDAKNAPQAVAVAIRRGLIRLGEIIPKGRR